MGVVSDRLGRGEGRGLSESGGTGLGGLANRLTDRLRVGVGMAN